MKIAIIGGGIAGLSTAWMLHRRHQITLYESAPRLGGHTATVDINLGGRQYAVDTGFIVFNDTTYPNFNRLIERLGVGIRNTEMGFSVSSRLQRGNDFEYSGSGINGLFADRSNLLRPAFVRMVSDIARFSRKARHDVTTGQIDPNQVLSDYLDRDGYGSWFKERYILPMAAAIWSASTVRVSTFNALFFLRFFYNHGLLNLTDRPQWHTVEGGSRSYIKPLTAGFKNKIRLNEPVRAVNRTHDGVVVKTDHDSECYDQVVLACHPDQSLALISTPTDAEVRLLSAIPYQDNSVTLHTDRQMLPRRTRTWSSWNYLLDSNESEMPVLTYQMNILQGLESPEPICVTLNGDAHIDPAKILHRFNYAHPQFGPSSHVAHSQLGKINGQNRTWFCGAWCGNGFHEDGVTSAVAVSEALEGDRP